MTLAQIQNPLVGPLSPGVGGRTDVGILELLLTGIIRVLIIGAAVFFVFFFIIGALRWIMSGGDPKSIESARNQIVHALIGLVIIFSLFAVLRLLDVLFGINILQIDFELLKIR